MSSTIDGIEAERPRATPSDAVGELLCVCILGLLPLVLFCVIEAIKQSSAGAAFTAFFGPIAKGQLFLYSFSMIGSLFWLFITQIKLYNKFWLGVYSVWLFVPALSAMFFYGMNPSMGQAIHWLLIVLSGATFTVYVWLYYSLIVHVPERVGGFSKKMSAKAEQTAAEAKEFIR